MFNKLIILTVLTFGFSGASQAVLLSGAGITDFPIGGTTLAAEPNLAGVVNLETVTTPFSISGAGETLSGLISSQVLRAVDGTVDFYWRILPDEGSGDISAFRLSGFEGFSLNANWRIDGLGEVAPTTARYFGDGTGNVNFIFGGDEVGGNGVTVPYTTSRFFFLDTDALTYSLTGSFDLVCAPQECISQSYSTFAPAVVPVPAAVWLFGTALAGFIGYSRRRIIA